MTRTPIIVIACALAANAAAADPTLAHQGRLLDALGGPVSGAHTLRLALYDDATGGTQLHTEDFSLTILDGYYAVVLGEDTGNLITASDLAGDVWLEIILNPPAAPLGARQRLHDVPRAALALTATSGGGSGGGVSGDWVDVSTSQLLEVNRSYMTTTASEVVLDLPSTCLAGDNIHVRAGAGPLRIGLGVGQSVHDLATDSVTTGPNTRVIAQRYGAMDMVCVSDGEWHIREGKGQAGICAVGRVVPKMFGPSQDGVVVSESSSNGTAYRGWKVFDDVLGSADGSWDWLATSVSSAWLRVDFPQPTVLTGYSMAMYYQATIGSFPGSWTFEGSTDGSSWTTLDTVTVESWDTNGPTWSQATKFRAFYFDNEDPYSMYRLNISAKIDPSYPHISVAAMRLFDCQ